jgi:hypothetical protein
MTSSWLWLALSLGGLLLAGCCTYRDMRLAGRVMLLREAFSVLAIGILCALVLTSIGRAAGMGYRPVVRFPFYGPRSAARMPGN